MGAIGQLATVDDECLARVLSKQHSSVLSVLIMVDGAARSRLLDALTQRSLDKPDMSCMTHILPYKCAIFCSRHRDWSQGGLECSELGTCTYVPHLNTVMALIAVLQLAIIHFIIVLWGLTCSALRLDYSPGRLGSLSTSSSLFQEVPTFARRQRPGNTSRHIIER